MNTLNLFNTENWKSLSQKPLLYVGFHEKNGTNYVVVTTQKQLMLVQEFDKIHQSRSAAIKSLQSFTNGVPVIFNQLKTKSFWDSFQST